MKPQQLLIDLVEQFCVYQQKQRGKTEGGVTTYRWNLDQFLVFVRKREGRPARVGDLSPETVQAWMDQMVAADLALSTMRARQSTLSSLSARLVKRSPAHRHDADLCDDPASAAQACGRLLRGQGCAHVERLERFFESRRRQDFRNGTLDRRRRDSNAERDASTPRDGNKTSQCGPCFRNKTSMSSNTERQTSTNSTWWRQRDSNPCSGAAALSAAFSAGSALFRTRENGRSSNRAEIRREATDLDVIGQRMFRAGSSEARIVQAPHLAYRFEVEA